MTRHIMGIEFPNYRGMQADCWGSFFIMLNMDCLMIDADNILKECNVNGFILKWSIILEY